MVTDISRLKNAEEKLARNEKKFRHIFDAAPYLIISVNRQGIIVDCNRRMNDVLQYNKGEILGKPFVSLVHGDYADTAKEYFQQALTTGSSRNQIYRMQKKDGTSLDASVSASGLKDQHGTFFRVVCIVEDITGLRQMQESLLRKNEDLAASFEELTAIEEELRHTTRNCYETRLPSRQARPGTGISSRMRSWVFTGLLRTGPSSRSTRPLHGYSATPLPMR
jgi:PAS domain S-box-containing protein